MKNNKYKPFFRSLTVAAIMMGASAANVLAQGTIKGKVLDQHGTPVAGANLTVKGTTIATVSDENGDFKLGNVPSGSQTINVSYLGLQPAEEAFMVVDGATISQNISLNGGNGSSSNSSKSEIVNVAYRKVNSDEIIGGVSWINIPEVYAKGYSNSVDNIQSFVSGFNGNSLRGGSTYLLLVDGVPRESANVVPSEIEQISILKGPEATLLYGSIGSQGAILITTKRGKRDGLNISARAASGVNASKIYPEYLGAAEYMVVNNQVNKADNLPEVYTEEEIYKTAVGLNPYKYPDMNLYSSDYLRKIYNFSDATMEIEGGNEKTHFYTNVGFYRQGQPVKIGEMKDAGASRFNIRGNVDVTITKAITAFIDANTTFYDGKSANGNFWSAAANMRPNYPRQGAALIPLSMVDPDNDAVFELLNSSQFIIDGEYFLSGTQETKTNEIANIYAAGNSKNTIRQFQFDAGVKGDLSSLLKGLYLRTDYAVDYRSSYTTSFNNSYATFAPVWGNVNGVDGIVSLEKMNEDKKSGSQNISGSTNLRTISANGILGWDDSFGDHNFKTMFVATMYQKTNDKKYHKAANANLGLMLNYNLAHKYFANVNLGIPHTVKLEEGNRNGFSKSVELGWNLKNEDFLKNSSAISSLMLSASLSAIDDAERIVNPSNSGNTDDDYYMYADNWITAWGYGWKDGNQSQYTYNQAGANKDLDFIHRKTFSATLRAGFLNDMVTLEGTYFKSKWDNLTAKLSTQYPGFFTPGYPAVSFIPVVNYGAEERSGFEFGATFNKSFGDVKVNAGVYGTYYDTKVTKRDEKWNEDYLYRTGNPIDGVWAYQTQGIFQTQEQIDDFTNNYAEQKVGATPKPGDIMYIDQNGDKVINSDDQVYLGKGGWYGSPFTMGINLTVQYKRFTLFALASAYTGSIAFKNNSYYFMNGPTAKYSAIARDCWTEDTPDATYPRLTSGDASNNYKDSDFWMFKNNKFLLNKVQLTYTFPASAFEGNFISGLALHFTASGDNTGLLMISKERKHLETNIGSAPYSRQFLLGASISF